MQKHACLLDYVTSYIDDWGHYVILEGRGVCLIEIYIMFNIIL